MSSPTPHHRHQTSLEEIINFSVHPSLTTTQRAIASNKFARIVQHFESIESIDDDNGRSRNVPYSQPRLIRYSYEFALSEESRDIFLRAFFGSLALPVDEDSEQLDFAELKPLFCEFAEYLMDNFFFPLKASTRQTPQPSPALHSAVMRAQTAETESLELIGTPERLSSLRGACLVRDRHRCVISRVFSIKEYTDRYKKDRGNACDDDGVLFSQQQNRQFESLEVAHILPHALTKSRGTGSGELDRTREAALAILNMFDSGVVNLINGVDIDRPRNALTLAISLHPHFGAFDIYFDALPGQVNTYRIRSFLPPMVTTSFNLPVTRTLYVTDTRTIDPPSPRLLAIHRAIAHILHLSGAGDYIDRVLRDMEDNVVKADGSSDLGRMVALGLGDWCGKAY